MLATSIRLSITFTNSLFFMVSAVELNIATALGDGSGAGVLAVPEVLVGATDCRLLLACLSHLSTYLVHLVVCRVVP